MLEGCLTALVTPFQQGRLDETAFADFVDWQVRAGVGGLVTATLAGEGPTLLAEEQGRLIRIAVEVSAGRVPVIAASGTNCTRRTIELTAAAREAGAAAALIVAPYYSRPTQEGLFRHFEAVARAIDMPIIVHNAPSRTAVSLEVSTIRRLAAIPAFVGLLDESEDASSRFCNALACKTGMARLAAGEFDGEPPGMAHAQAYISLAANVAPDLCVAIAKARRHRDEPHLKALLDRMLPLRKALGHEPDPVATKYAVTLLRPNFDPAVRLPLAPISAATAAAVRVAVAELARPLPAHSNLDRAVARTAHQMDLIVRGP